MEKGLVYFKGMADGVRIYLHDTAPMYEILDELEQKINANRAFFGDGNCRISFSGRPFTGGEKQRLTDAMAVMLPLGRVVFDAPKQKRSDTDKWLNEYREKHSNAAADAREEMEAEEDEEKPAEQEEFISRFRSNRARLFQGILESGGELYSDGHLILIGTAENGSELRAVGNIIVEGGLYGSAHAGCNGHNGSYIIAMDMRPERLAIADITETYSYIDESEKIFDETETKRSFIDKFKKKKEPADEQEENKRNSSYSAVALCKNHKIELDNFTIHTFTNPKNMI